MDRDPRATAVWAPNRMPACGRWPTRPPIPEYSVCSISASAPAPDVTPWPSARRGHPVDVVEMTQKFADMIRADTGARIAQRPGHPT